MAVQQKSTVGKSHVNFMIDTIITSLPPEALRSVMRSMLTTNPEITSVFEDHTRRFLARTGSQPAGSLFDRDNIGSYETTANFVLLQQRIRAMMGSGMCFESLKLLAEIIHQCRRFDLKTLNLSEKLSQCFESVDGDLVQASTAVEKVLTTSSGTRDLTEDELGVLNVVLQELLACREDWKGHDKEFPFYRSLSFVACLLEVDVDVDVESSEDHTSVKDRVSADDISAPLETFEIRGTNLPRLFGGLWQLSGPSFGIASQTKIFQQFRHYLRRGFTAWDMSDHYGDAEVIFGSFRASLDQPDVMFGATKLCIFKPTTVTEKLIHDNITTRCRRMHSKTLDMLQFHWQNYEDKQYVEALRLLQADERIRFLGLCNFDTLRMKEILDAGVQIVTNQVQFSLIDARPTLKMGKVCDEHGVKLLTYGTLCGGFLADKWLDKPDPELFSNDITPSQRKYFEMITAWGGWSLFQDLLKCLRVVADKHHVAISNVATRWVLEFPYVGAVLVGARMGVSEHSAENLKTYGWHLDSEDQKLIEQVLARSQRSRLFETHGDCGDEYR